MTLYHIIIKLATHIWFEVLGQEKISEGFSFILILCNNLGCGQLRQLFRSFSIKNILTGNTPIIKAIGGTDMFKLFFLHSLFHFGDAEYKEHKLSKDSSLNRIYVWILFKSNDSQIVEWKCIWNLKLAFQELLKNVECKIRFRWLIRVFFTVMLKLISILLLFFKSF